MKNKGRTGLGPGMRKVTDWVDRKVATTRPLRNGMTEIPEGFVATVTHARSGLTLLGEPCSCCGVRVYIRGVSADAVRLQE